MGLGFFRTAGIAGGAAADVYRGAEEKKDKLFNDALNDFVDNNVPRFMEAKQKRIGIRTKLTQDLQTIVSKYIQPDKIGLDQNSGYELAEKLLFDNGGKIENVDKQYATERDRYAGTEKFDASVFIKNYFNSPKTNQDSRTLDQIITSKAQELSPDPTIDIQGKAEALAGYKDSVFYKMDRDTVASRLIAATGYTDPVPISKNVYGGNYVKTESKDPMIDLNLKAKKQTIQSNELTIDDQKMNQAIGEFKPGKISDLYNDNLQKSFQTFNVKGNWDSVTKKWKDIRGKGSEIVNAMQQSFQSTTQNLINSKDLNTNDFVKSMNNTLVFKQEGSTSKKYVLPDLTSIANGIMGESLPVDMSKQPMISVDEGSNSGKPPNGNIIQIPDPAYKGEGNVSEYETGRVYLDGDGRKFMFLKTKPKTVGSRIINIVDLASRFYFDPIN